MIEADGDNRRMVCHKGVFSPQLFFTYRYTNDQPVHDGTRSFIFADELCITAQFRTFSQVESTIDKTQVTAFHLRNREAKRSLKVSGNRVVLENTTQPKYLGVTLDRTLNYKQHTQNTKMKVATRNNLLNKLANSKWEQRHWPCATQ